MADRSFTFLQDYPVEFQLIDTGAGPSLDRDDSSLPLVNSTNVGIYRDLGTDSITTAMQDLTQKKFIDQLVQNKYAQAGLKSAIESYHDQIFDPTSRRIARTLLKNAQGASTITEALQNIYDAVVLQGLSKHFPIEPQPAVFNLNATPPSGFATLTQTKINQPPQVPPSIGFAKDYDGFSAAYGFEYEKGSAPSIPGSNYGNDYPSRKQTGGSGSQTTAPESIIGECFDTFINAVDQKVALTHEGVTPAGVPITTSDVVTMAPPIL